MRTSSLFDPYLFHSPYHLLDQEAKENKTTPNNSDVLNVSQIVTVTVNPSNLLEVPAYIFGQSVKNCLDTGSTRTFIKASYLDNLDPTLYDIITLDATIKIQLGNQDSMICQDMDDILYYFESSQKLIFIPQQLIFKLEASAKHPQTNGKTERFIRFLTRALATVIAKDQGNWDLLLDSCLFAYRVTINKTIQ
ncbi:gag-pol fusion [Brachionus plicatilis]|uniref:Gag-pol fusion n=1 Tax=Brachionus plicatilis TaxID=10195 RepID=A0A3M7SB18_BRAPC|nr:gag-pol fusion [Brachionus plicatilis]